MMSLCERIWACRLKTYPSGAVGHYLVADCTEDKHHDNSYDSADPHTAPQKRCEYPFINPQWSLTSNNFHHGGEDIPFCLEINFQGAHSWMPSLNSCARDVTSLFIVVLQTGFFNCNRWPFGSHWGSKTLSDKTQFIGQTEMENEEV